MTNPRNEELPRLNYLWIGPPRPPESNLAGNLVYGSDVQGVIEMSKKTKNPIYYYCLDEHVTDFKKVFAEQGAPVEVVSLDAYLKEMKNHADPEIQKHAAKMLEMKNEVLNKPRDRIVDRVSFKDAFSLFLLATQGGYTLDTSVRPSYGKTNIVFNEYDHFKCPSLDMDNECWMMYASPKALEEPRQMLHHYMTNWDKVQDIIRGNERTYLNVLKFHAQIPNLMINSIDSGQELIEEINRIDRDWMFSLELQPTGSTIVGIATPRNLPVEKLYGNTHKAVYVCRDILKEDVTAYVNQPSPSHLNRDARTNLLNNLQESLKKYDTEMNRTEFGDFNEKISDMFEAVKKLDQYAGKLAGVSSHYQSNDKNKRGYADRIDQRIDAAYKELAGILKEGKKIGLKSESFKALNAFKEDIKVISQEAKNYHANKHSLFGAKTRFGTNLELDPKTPTPRK